MTQGRQPRKKWDRPAQQGGPLRRISNGRAGVSRVPSGMTFSCEKQGRVAAEVEGPLGHETGQGRSREVRCTALAIINKPAALLCDLLQSEPNTPVLEQGCANEATSSRPREHRSEARPLASSLRSHLIYDRDRWLAKSCIAASCAAAKFAENYWGRILWIDRLRLPRCGGWWGGCGVCG